MCARFEADFDSIRARSKFFCRSPDPPIPQSLTAQDTRRGPAQLTGGARTNPAKTRRGRGPRLGPPKGGPVIFEHRRPDYCFSIEKPRPDLKPPGDVIRDPDRLFNDLYAESCPPGVIARNHNITLETLL